MTRIGGDRRTGLIGASLACLVAAGCGSSTGGVTGKVSYKGKSVVSGSVVLIASDGMPRYGDIQPDGSYRFNGVPTGEAKLGVNSPNPVPDPRKVAVARAAGQRGGRFQTDPITGTPTSDPSLWFPIPRAAGDPATSSLRATIRPGENTHNIVLD